MAAEAAMRRKRPSGRRRLGGPGTGYAASGALRRRRASHSTAPRPANIIA